MVGEEVPQGGKEFGKKKGRLRGTTFGKGCMNRAGEGFVGPEQGYQVRASRHLPRGLRGGVEVNARGASRSLLN